MSIILHCIWHYLGALGLIVTTGLVVAYVGVAYRTGIR
jgi:hypothetical protein